MHIIRYFVYNVYRLNIYLYGQSTQTKQMVIGYGTKYNLNNMN